MRRILPILLILLLWAAPAWADTEITSDNFTRGSYPTANLGPNWTDLVPGWYCTNSLGSPAAYTTGSSSNNVTLSYWNAYSFNANQYSTYQINSAECGAAVRCSLSGAYFSYYDYTNFQFLKLASPFTSSPTQIGSNIAISIPSSDYIKLTINGSTLTAYYSSDNATWTEIGSVTDSTYSMGSPGISCTWMNRYIDYWEGGNLVASAPKGGIMVMRNLQRFLDRFFPAKALAKEITR